MTDIAPAPYRERHMVRAWVRLLTAIGVVAALVLAGAPVLAAAGDDVAIDDVAQSETNADSTFTFTVTITDDDSTPGTGGFTITWQTRDGTANGGAACSANVDYITDDDELNAIAVPPATSGDQTVTIDVTVCGDTHPEPDETFFVDIAVATGENVTKSEGVGTIQNDASDGDVPTLSIDNQTTIPEGDSGTTTTATFTVSLIPASTQPVTVDFATQDDSATASEDYDATSDTLTFSAGQTSKSVPVTINGDDKDEPDEAFNVVLTDADNAAVADDTGDGKILDDDDPPDVAIHDVAKTEGNSGATTTFDFPVVLSAVSGKDVTVDFATADDDATAGSDYNATSGTLLITAGQITGTITVEVTGDDRNEPDETFLVNISNEANATITDSQGVGTIQNDDPPPTINISDAGDIDENDTGSQDAVFSVTLSEASGKTVTVDFTTVDGTATAGEDYDELTGTITLSPGQTSKSIRVPVHGDTIDEFHETFTAELLTPTAVNGTVGDGVGEARIVDDDTPPTLSIDDVVAAEGDSGTKNFDFTVSLSQASGKTVTVDWHTEDRTATAPSDYTAVGSTTLTFAPSELTKTVSVAVNGDTLNESDETFAVILDTDTESNATIADGEGIGTILDDDPGPTVNVNDSSVTEGDSGTVLMHFDITLSEASGSTVTVDWATADGSARAGEDYDAAFDTATFASGELTKTISITVHGDTVAEADETFTVNLSNATGGASLGDGEGVGTIVDDDGPPPSLGFTTDVTDDEGDTGSTPFTFTVERTGDSDGTSSVDYATSDGGAVAPEDYTAASGTIVFAPGELTQTVTVEVNGDTKFEDDEAFTVELSNPSNAVLGDDEATGTITNDDGQPAISAVDPSPVTEGDSGTTDVVVTVALSNPSENEITVDFTTNDGSADGGVDYTGVDGTITFAPGETEKTVTIQVIGDTVDEFDETLSVDLSAATGGATIGDSQATVTIVDDDDPPALSIGDATVTEGDAGEVEATFTVTLSEASEKTVTVDFATADGTAGDPADYTARSGSLSFAPGETSKQITVKVQGDTLDEDNETFDVSLSNAGNASVADGTGLGTITDDDPSPSLSIDDVTVTEGHDGTVDATFTLTLSEASGRTVTVDFTTADGTAGAPGDYTAASGTVTFAAGDTSETVTVKVQGDTLDEPNETFTVGLSNPTNVTIADGTGTGTITDDDPAPSLSIDDVTVIEGDVGTVNARFTVSLSSASGQTVTVDFATADGTATAPTDYTATSGTLTFAPGEATKQVAAAVNGDTTIEDDETFTVTLSNPANAAIADGTGTGTITNDDGPDGTGLGQGYAIVGGDGGIFTFGDADFFGSMGGQQLNSPVISMAYTPTGEGYWLVAGDGGIFSFGDAAFHGSMGGQQLNAPVLGMEATPTGEGYWLFASDGGIFSFGDADFHGSMGATPLNAPVVGMAATSTGDGYWLVAQDGGIFSFGDATFQGSTGNLTLNEPVFDMDATADDGGYWLVARDGGIFTFGNATFHGSAAGQGATTVIGMGATPTADGYWIADDRGAVFVFGDAQFLGDMRNTTLNAPAVGFAALPG